MKGPDERFTLPRLLPLDPLLDPHGLRAIGRTWLQRLGGEPWSDHNVHDPGIAQLGSLVFAITDLVHRIDHPVADLIAVPPDGADPKPMFTAAEALTCAPVTLRDRRKLIVDVPGVQNTWIEIAPDGEVPLEVLRGEERLAVRDLDAEPPEPNPPPDAIPLRGLTDILLEFEADPGLGDLNDTRVVLPAVGAAPALELRFIRWNPPNGRRIDDADLDPDRPEVRAANDRGGWTVDGLDGDLSAVGDGTLRGIVQMQSPSGVRRIAMRIGDPRSARGLDVVAPVVQAGLEADDNLLLRGAIETWLARIRRRQAVAATVRARLSAHRPLCEDVLSLRGLALEEIGLCIDIELAPGAEAEHVEAEILYRVGRFLAPRVAFVDLDTLLEAGVPSDRIFDGPRLQHGFVQDATLDAPFTRETVQGSDLIQILMRIPGVEAVRRLLMTNYVDGEAQVTGEPWLLRLRGGGLLPRLSLRRSRLRYFHGHIPFVADAQRVDEKLAALQARTEQPRLPVGDHDLPIPAGRTRGLDQFTSVQTHLPLNYGIGRYQVRASAPPARHAAARQLRAWLTLFDQILADLQAQLGAARLLLAVGGTVEDSRAVRPLPAEAPGMSELLRMPRADQPWPAWPHAGDEEPAYVDHLRQLIEGDDPSEDPALSNRWIRLERVVDHLLARLGESLTSHSTIVHAMEGPLAARQLVGDKRQFLKTWTVSSARRGTGIDTHDADRAGNVTGLTHRVANALGLSGQPVRLAVVDELFAVVLDGGVWFVRHRSTALISTVGWSRGEAYARVERAVAAVLLATPAAVAVGPGFGVELGPGLVLGGAASAQEAADHAALIRAQAIGAGPAWACRTRRYCFQVDRYLQRHQDPDGWRFTLHLPMGPRLVSVPAWPTAAEVNAPLLRALTDAALRRAWLISADGARVRLYAAHADFLARREHPVDLDTTADAEVAAVQALSQASLSARRGAALAFDLVPQGGATRGFRLTVTDGQLRSTQVYPGGQAARLALRAITADALDRDAWQQQPQGDGTVRLTLHSGGGGVAAFVPNPVDGPAAERAMERVAEVVRDAEAERLLTDFGALQTADERWDFRRPLSDGSFLRAWRSTRTRAELGRTLRQLSRAPADSVGFAAVEEVLQLRIRGSQQALAELSGGAADLPEALALVDRLVAFFTARFAAEGLTVVEHVLLRPREAAADPAATPLISIRIDPDVELPTKRLDPYSFRATVVLPAWPERFRDLRFRSHVEETIRLEAPSHVALKICWVDPPSMWTFQKTWRAWLRDPTPPHLADLLAAMDALRSHFPVAVLHDCQDPGDSNPVVLGHTSLGALSPAEETP